MEQLTNIELKIINESIEANPSRYFPGDSMSGYQKPSERNDLTAILRNEFGEKIATKASANKAYSLLGIRSLYPEFYFQALRASKIERTMQIADRGIILKVVLDGQGYYIKPYQEEQEKKIAPLMDMVGVGPKVWCHSKELVEEDLGEQQMPFFSDLFQTGREIGRLYRKMHNVCVVYRDSIVRHLRYVSERKRLYLIDFGISFYDNGSLYPKKSLQEPFSIASLKESMEKYRSYNIAGMEAEYKKYLQSKKPQPSQYHLDELEALKETFANYSFLPSILFPSSINAWFKRKIIEGIDAGYSSS